MTYLVVDQYVEDVNRWVAAVSSASERRRAAGGELIMALNHPDDPNHLLVIVRFESAEHARAWRNRPGVEQELSQEGGAILDSIRDRYLEQLPL